MRWPRGKRNGRRIVGVQGAVKIDLTVWHWKPYIGHYCGACHWLCVLSWWGWTYGER